MPYFIFAPVAAMTALYLHGRCSACDAVSSDDGVAREGAEAAVALVLWCQLAVGLAAPLCEHAPVS
jgi:hypothetical protein